MTALIGAAGIFGAAILISSGYLAKLLDSGDLDAVMTIGVTGALLLQMLGAKGTGKIVYWVLVGYLILKIVA